MAAADRKLCHGWKMSDPPDILSIGISIHILHMLDMHALLGGGSRMGGRD